MTDIDSILARIRVGLARHGRKSEVSRLTGMNSARLADVSKPDWNPTADTIRRLDAAIDTLFPADAPTPPPKPE